MSSSRQVLVCQIYSYHVPRVNVGPSHKPHTLQFRYLLSSSVKVTWLYIDLYRNKRKKTPCFTRPRDYIFVFRHLFNHCYYGLWDNTVTTRGVTWFYMNIFKLCLWKFVCLFCWLLSCIDNVKVIWQVFTDGEIPQYPIPYFRHEGIWVEPPTFRKLAG